MRSSNFNKNYSNTWLGNPMAINFQVLLRSPGIAKLQGLSIEIPFQTVRFMNQYILEIQKFCMNFCGQYRILIKTRIPRMELMPTASRYLLELKSFKKLSLKFYISRYLFFKKLKSLQILCDFQKYL